MNRLKPNPNPKPKWAWSKSPLTRRLHFNSSNSTWGQKLLGALAALLALLLLCNPELLALGFLGDAAFFDLLVVLISLQIQTTATRVWHRISTAWTGFAQHLRTPRLSYCMALWIIADITTALSTLQRDMQQRLYF